MFFDTPPEDFSPQFTTVACAVECNGKLLVIQRAAGPYAGYWGLPAGKQEAGEPVLVAAARELVEETGVSIDPGKLTVVLSRPARYPEADFWFHMAHGVVTALPVVQSNKREVADYQWLMPSEALQLHHLPNFDDQLKVLYPDIS